MKIALLNGPAADGSLFVREGRCTQRSSIWSTQWPPVSLAYLAAIARESGHEPVIYDCPAMGITLPELVNTLIKIAPEFVLLAISTPSFRFDMEVAAAIRKTLPNSLIGLFGVHATVLDQEILKANPFVDLILRGEPEGSFQNILQAHIEGRGLETIEGLTFRSNEHPIRNTDRPFIEYLDSLPLPAWDLVDLDNYLLPFRGERFLCLTPSRGCPYRCSFCTGHKYYGRKLRLRSVESVIEEINHNRRQFGVDDFFIWTETFTLNRNFVLEICLAMQRDTPGIRWTCNSRTDTVDSELLEQMRKAGCWMISFGIESADQVVLEKANKKLDINKVREPIQAARNAGLVTLGHFIFGLPGDTCKTIKKTAELARNLPLDFVQFYAAAPFVGSDLYEQGIGKGWLGTDQFESIGQDKASLNLSGLSPNEINKAKFRATCLFYLHPGRILFLLKFASWGLVRQGKRLLLLRVRRLTDRLRSSH